MNTYAFISIFVPMLCGVPVIKYSQAMGGFKNFFNRIYAKLILPKVKLICARGEITRSNLAEIGIVRNVKLCADGAFSMPDDAAVTQEVNELCAADPFYNNQVIALSVSSVVEKKCTKLGIDYKKIMTEFVDYLTGHQYHVLIIANAARMGSSKSRNNDLMICQAVYDAVKDTAAVRWYYEEMTAEKIRELIAKSRALVASRFHSMIGGLYKGVPVLLIGWSHKYKEVLDMFDLGQYAIDFSKLSLNTLVEEFNAFMSQEKVIRDKIQKHLPDVYSSSRKNIEYASAYINEVVAHRPRRGLFDFNRTEQYLGRNIACRMGYAKDETIRENAASGGMVTALLCDMLRSGEIDGAWVTKTVIHSGDLQYQTFVATTEEEIRACSSSIYMHMPLMKHLSVVRDFDGKVAVVLLPCQLRMLEHILEKDSVLKEKIVARFGLFCSGCIPKSVVTASLKKMGHTLDDATKFYFRRGLWRGPASILYNDGHEESFSYIKSIGAYKNAYFYTGKGCMVCQDQFASVADLSFGDIWLKEMKKKKIKHTGCVIRTGTGWKIYQHAIHSGAISDFYISKRKMIMGQKRALVFKFRCAKAKVDHYSKCGAKLRLNQSERCRWNHALAFRLAELNRRLSKNHPQAVNKIPLQLIYYYMLLIRTLLSF